MMVAATVLAYAAAIVLRRVIFSASSEATIWLSAVLIVGLLFTTGRYRLACFVACLGVNFVANFLFDLSLRTYLTFPLAALVTWLTTRMVGPTLNFAHPKRLWMFLAFAAVPACALFAAILLLLPSWAGPPATIEVSVRWFFGHFLGCAILIPSMSILTRPYRFKGFSRSVLEMSAFLALTLGYVTFVMWRNERSGWDLLAFPLAMFMAFRYGPVGVSLLSLALTALALAYIYGAIPHLGPDALSFAQTQWVQIFVALIYLTSLPAAGSVASFQRMRNLYSRRTLTARSARRRADGAAQAKGEFLANMSHEIRTPLNGVIGLADALTRTSIDRAQREMLEMILSSGKALRGLLSDTLDLARAEAGSLALDNEPFDVRQTIGAASYLFESLAREKGLTFDVDFDLPDGCMVAGDALRIRQIVSNFISNAVKFTEKGGIVVETSLEGADIGRGRLTVRVHDSGAGFDDETKARLFNRFEQGDSSITRRHGGSGLGLSISRKLAEMMGGEIACDSVPGQGSVFSFSVLLPAHAAPTQAPVPAVAAAAPSGPAPGRRLSLLVAEDHVINQKVIQAILADHVELVIVGDGQAAYDRFALQAFDVVLMDTHMPVMDGLSAIRLIRALEAARGAARTPIISLTADAMPQHIGVALAAGADMHLAKPITAEALYAALEAVLPETASEPLRAAS